MLEPSASTAIRIWSPAHSQLLLVAMPPTASGARALLVEEFARGRRRYPSLRMSDPELARAFRPAMLLAVVEGQATREGGDQLDVMRERIGARFREAGILFVEESAA